MSLGLFSYNLVCWKNPQEEGRHDENAGNAENAHQQA